MSLESCTIVSSTLSFKGNVGRQLAGERFERQDVFPCELAQDGLLGGEVLVQGAGGDVCLLRDVHQRGLLVAQLAEEVDGGIVEMLLHRPLVLLTAWHGSSPFPRHRTAPRGHPFPFYRAGCVSPSCAPAAGAPVESAPAAPAGPLPAWRARSPWRGSPPACRMRPPSRGSPPAWRNDSAPDAAGPGETAPGGRGRGRPHAGQRAAPFVTGFLQKGQRPSRSFIHV